MGIKTPCLGAQLGSLNKTLVARTRNLGVSGDRAPIRQQPCHGVPILYMRIVHHSQCLCPHVGIKWEMGTATTIFSSDKLTFFNILTGPRIANASLDGPIHQDVIKHFYN